MTIDLLGNVLPDSSVANASGHLEIGGVDTVRLIEEFGTPLYVYDEATLRARCREFVQEFSNVYTNVEVAYASKALLSLWMASIIKEEGLSLDVVSAGELALAQEIQFPPDKVYFHGNNKTPDELREAVRYRIGYVVVDNLYELGVLENICKSEGVTQNILLRVTPGFDVHTHAYTATGVLDSKFGAQIVTGMARQLLGQALKAQHVNVKGIHFHLGSPIPELQDYVKGIDIVLDFVAEAVTEGLSLDVLNVGGGFAIPYMRTDIVPTVREYAVTIATGVLEGCKNRGIELPHLVIEPGRSIVGTAGVAFYTVGSVKEIPGIRVYCAVDGGMGDNIRPALYGASYEAILANKAVVEATSIVTIVGKYCESGDILVRDIKLPPVSAGDILAVPVSGAYCLSMSSNYNMALHPAVVLVDSEGSRMVRRRQTFHDLIAAERETLIH
jgi:diaminopimelate decarboxylase